MPPLFEAFQDRRMGDGVSLDHGGDPPAASDGIVRRSHHSHVAVFQANEGILDMQYYLCAGRSPSPV